MTTPALTDEQTSEAGVEELEGGCLVTVSHEMWEKVKRIAAKRDIGPGEALSEAIELESTILQEGGTSPDVYVRRPDGSFVKLAPA